MVKEFYDYAEKLYSYCPYLKKSKSKDLLDSKRVIFYSEKDDEYSKKIFYECLIETERFRIKRRTLDMKDCPYYSLNIVFDSKFEKNYKWEEMMSWPHYMLKYLYSKEQIMFGKFWKGEKTKSRITNKIIPESNINFISIRTAIKERDPKLLFESIEIKKIIESSYMSTRDVNFDYFKKSIFDMNKQELYDSGYYEYLKKYLTEKLLKS